MYVDNMTGEMINLTDGTTIPEMKMVASGQLLLMTVVTILYRQGVIGVNEVSRRRTKELTTVQ